MARLEADAPVADPHDAAAAEAARLEAPPRIEINRLADWTSTGISSYGNLYWRPGRPSMADGFRSIGRMPCTGQAVAGGDDRGGRGGAKSDCGIRQEPAAYENDGSGI